jgi:hypothetical protein
MDSRPCIAAIEKGLQRDEICSGLMHHRPS